MSAETVARTPITVQLDLDIPRSINHAYLVAPPKRTTRGMVPPRVVKDPAARRYQESVVVAAARAEHGRCTIAGPISLRIRLVVQREADIDIDNGLKVLVDGLARAYGFDDRVIHRLIVSKLVRPLAEPRCSVTLVGFGS